MQGGEGGADRLLAMQAVAPGGGEAPHQRLHPFAPLRRELCRTRRCVEPELGFDMQRTRDPERLVEVLGLLCVAGRLRQDERHACLVDQNAVRFVDDRHAQSAQQRCSGFPCKLVQTVLKRIPAAAKPVSQIVEDQFLGGAVGDVAGIGGATFRRLLSLSRRTDAEAERGVDRSQQVGVARDQIIIGGDHMHRDAGQRGGCRGKGHCVGLALAGGHFRQTIGEHDFGRDHLGVKNTDLELALAGHGGERERLRHMRIAHAFAL